MKSLDQVSLDGRLVFARVDFNVPLDGTGAIRDDTRIRATLPTIRHIIERKARLVLASHLGRPKGKFDPKLSLKPVALRLAELLGRDVVLAPGVVGDEVERLKSALQPGGILLLENVRFQAEETANDPAFSEQLAKGVDVFVNDAFGSSHRAHASVVGIAGLVGEKAAGFLLQREVEYLSRAVHSPLKPYVAILGGAKVSDKIPVIKNLIGKADHILIGGAMAYTFFKAQGCEVGRSLVEDDKKDLALEILRLAAEHRADLVLPSDHLLTAAIEPGAPTEVVSSFPFPEDRLAVDIGPATVHKYAEIIGRAKMIVWNGPLGIFEIDEFAQGTLAIARAVAGSGAVSIVGGGDSIGAVEKAGVTDKITHISTGGGASLEYLAYGTLPGIEALD